MNLFAGQIGLVYVVLYTDGVHIIVIQLQPVFCSPYRNCCLLETFLCATGYDLLINVHCIISIEFTAA